MMKSEQEEVSTEQAGIIANFFNTGLKVPFFLC